MELIYKNNYGVTYKVKNHINKKYTLQLVINNVGIFMSDKELHNLLKLVQASYGLDQECNCEKCKGAKLNKLWKTNLLVDICLKVNDDVLALLEDLILGTQFMVNIDAVLETHRLN